MSKIFDFIESYEDDKLTITVDKDRNIVTFNDKHLGPFNLIFDINDTNLEIKPVNPKNPNDFQLAELIFLNKKFNKVNKIIELMEFIQETIPEITNYCVGCGIKMEFQSDTYVTCGVDVCDYRFEELYIGNPVTEAVKDDPDLIRFLYDSAKDAVKCARKYDIFEPFPTYFLKKSDTVKIVRGKMSALTGQQYNDLKDFDKLGKVFNKIKINKFLEAADLSYDDLELIKEIGHDMYSLMRFVILSCKFELRPDKLMRDVNKEQLRLDGKGKVIKGSIGLVECKAYKVVHTQQKNEEFLKLKGENGKSHFLFHGSGWHNWYSILRNGLKNCSGTKLMTAGAAYGNGIYLSDNAGLSFGYGRSGNRSVLGVFEVIGKKERYQQGKNSQVFVCPDETQLIQRYLLIVPNSSMNSAIVELNKIFNSEIYTKNKKVKTRLLSKGIKKIVKEYKKIIKQKPEQLGFRIDMDLNNTYLWKVFIFGYDPKSTIGKDMKDVGIEEIQLEVTFPQNYPISPPFIRVISPRFKYQTGHVTSAGALCMQILTDKHWSPACSIESLIITIKSEILEGEGQLDKQKYNIPYTHNEAKSSFHRVAKGHGWA
jgi:ubiquitin-protein ligase